MILSIRRNMDLLDQGRRFFRSLHQQIAKFGHLLDLCSGETDGVIQRPRAALQAARMWGEPPKVDSPRNASPDWPSASA